MKMLTKTAQRPRSEYTKQRGQFARVPSFLADKHFPRFRRANDTWIRVFAPVRETWRPRPGALRVTLEPAGKDFVRIGDVE